MVRSIRTRSLASFVVSPGPRTAVLLGILLSLSPPAASAQRSIVQLREAPLARGAAGRSPAAVATARDAIAREHDRIRAEILAIAGASPRAAGAGPVLRREYSVVFNGFAVDLPPDALAQLAGNADVLAIHEDTPVQATLDVSVPLIGAPSIWSGYGFDGAGQVIAIIDTGVDYTHADLGGCFGVGCKVIGGYDFVNGDGDPIDDQGHGTHVAATAAGAGALDGVAPGASILAYKVLGASGSGSSSDVIAAIEAATDPDGDLDPSDHVSVMNLSLGGPGDADDAGSQAIDAATAAGVVCAVSAGNEGPGYATIGSPGTARTAVTVGNSTDTDQISGSSSRGPSANIFGLKPELTAPGTGICAAQAGGTSGLACLDSSHVLKSGTSMASPHVAGAAALLRGLYPSLTPAEIKSMLVNNALDLGLNVMTGGAGRLELPAAASALTTIDPAAVSFGEADEGVAVWTTSQLLVVRNLDAASRSYTLTTTPMATGITATAIPSSFNLAAGASTVVSFEISVDNALVPGLSAAPSTYEGFLEVASGSQTQRVPFAFIKVASACDDATVIPAAGGVFSGSTSGDSTSTSSCPGGGGPETVFQWTPDTSGTATIDTCGGSGFDTVVYLRLGDCTSGSEVACNDDSCGLQSSVTTSVVAGLTYYIFVDGYSSGSSGSFTLTVSPPEGLPTPTDTPTATPTSGPDPASCPAVADQDCQTGFAKGFLLFKANVPGREKMVAKMLKGPQLDQTDMGNPLVLAGTSYGICIYDQSGLLASESIVDRAGEFCSGRPCWKSIGKDPPDGKGYKFNDKGLSSDGIQKIIYKGGDSGKSKVILKGKGPNLPDGVTAALQSSSSATVQLRSSDGECLSVTVNDIKKQESGFFKAKGSGPLPPPPDTPTPVQTLTPTSTPTETPTATTIHTPTATATDTPSSIEFLFNQATGTGSSFPAASVGACTEDQPAAVEAADDFVVPAGETWQVTDVYVSGCLTDTSTAGSGIQTGCDGTQVPDSFLVTFYQDSGGSPGAAVAAESGVALDPIQSSDGSYTCSGCTPGEDGFLLLTSPPSLSGGGGGTRYWVSVRGATTDCTGPAVWGWGGSVGVPTWGAPGKWRNAPGGHGIGCTGWSNVTSCLTLPTEDDRFFAVFGHSFPSP